MRPVVRWWKRGTGIVAVEYMLLVLVACIALAVGCTNLATALYVGSDGPPASVENGPKKDG
ncbi:MAG TPA: hypothetical protein VM533_09260 [Fimbriiglobus sp.]|jgi:hypothetical protein|nr:hypothetical protein [Fimbriiglobus sp.]